MNRISTAFLMGLILFVAIPSVKGQSESDLCFRACAIQNGLSWRTCLGQCLRPDYEGYTAPDQNPNMADPNSPPPDLFLRWRTDRPEGIWVPSPGELYFRDWLSDTKKPTFHFRHELPSLPDLSGDLG